MILFAFILTGGLPVNVLRFFIINKNQPWICVTKHDSSYNSNPSSHRAHILNLLLYITFLYFSMNSKRYDLIKQFIYHFYLNLFYPERLSNSLWKCDIFLFSKFINIVSLLLYKFIEFIIMSYTFLVFLCNVSNEIVVFHNSWNYDYHFMTKELSNEFEGQFEYLGENKEKYKTCSVPIKEKLHNKIYWKRKIYDDFIIKFIKLNVKIVIVFLNIEVLNIIWENINVDLIIKIIQTSLQKN